MTEGRRTKTISIRAYLEIKDEDGRVFYARTADVLASPKLQQQCTEKAALARIRKRVGRMPEMWLMQRRGK